MPRGNSSLVKCRVLAAFAHLHNNNRVAEIIKKGKRRKHGPSHDEAHQTHGLEQNGGSNIDIVVLNKNALSIKYKAFLWKGYASLLIFILQQHGKLVPS